MEKDIPSRREFLTAGGALALSAALVRVNPVQAAEASPKEFDIVNVLTRKNNSLQDALLVDFFEYLATQYTGSPVRAFSNSFMNDPEDFIKEVFRVEAINHFVRKYGIGPLVEVACATTFSPPSSLPPTVIADLIPSPLLRSLKILELTSPQTGKALSKALEPAEGFEAVNKAQSAARGCGDRKQNPFLPLPQVGG